MCDDLSIAAGANCELISVVPCRRRRPSGCHTPGWSRAAASSCSRAFHSRTARCSAHCLVPLFFYPIYMDASYEFRSESGHETPKQGSWEVCCSVL
eukprot:6213474-Pleurochrysis_carterae.AAC.5